MKLVVNDPTVIDLNGAGSGNSVTVAFTEQTAVLSDVDDQQHAGATVSRGARRLGAVTAKGDPGAAGRTCSASINRGHARRW